MKISILIVNLLLLAGSANCQLYSIKDFKDTEWFTKNCDSSFFKDDTIKLYKYSALIQKNDPNEFAEDEFSQLKCFPYLHIKFCRNSIMKVWLITIDGFVTRPKKWNRSWKFNDENKTLEIYLNGTIEFQLIPSSSHQIKVKSNSYEYSSPISCYELNFLKHK